MLVTNPSGSSRSPYRQDSSVRRRRSCSFRPHTATTVTSGKARTSAIAFGQSFPAPAAPPVSTTRNRPGAAPSAARSASRSASVAGGAVNAALTGRPVSVHRPAGNPSAWQLRPTATEGTAIWSTRGSRQARCAVTRSVITVSTGTAGNTRCLASTAGRVTMPWKATTAAGRHASMARVTDVRAGANAVLYMRESPHLRFEKRQLTCHSHGVSRISGAYSETNQRIPGGVPGPVSGSAISGSNLPGYWRSSASPTACAALRCPPPVSLMRNSSGTRLPAMVIWSPSSSAETGVRLLPLSQAVLQVVGNHGRPRRCRDPLAQRPVGQQRTQVLRCLAGLPGDEQIAAGSVRDQLRQGSRTGGYDGQAAGERVHGGDALKFSF